MIPTTLKTDLEKKGLIVLGIGIHHENPTIAVVYLSGNHGQWVGGHARALIKSIPGVVRVSESAQTPAIMLAEFQESGS